MPTLKEFVNDVVVENNLNVDQEEIIKMITDIAKERAIDGCCAISDEEVREMVINNAELCLRLAKEKKAKEKAKEEEKAKKEAERKEIELQKKLEKERQLAIGEQTSLFGD